MLESFDMADTDQTCPVRFVTTQPTQALGLLNSEFMQEQAGMFAEMAAEQHPESLEAQVRMALRRVTQREPSQEEVNRGLDLIGSLEKENDLSPEKARKYFFLVALNLNEFLYLD
jgi:hypothetical protein